MTPEKETGPSRDQFSINRNRIHTNISLRERENNFRNPYVCPELLYFVNAFEMKKNSGDSRPWGAPTPWNWKLENMFCYFPSEPVKVGFEYVIIFVLACNLSLAVCGGNFGSVFRVVIAMSSNLFVCKFSCGKFVFLGIGIYRKN